MNIYILLPVNSQYPWINPSRVSVRVQCFVFSSFLSNLSYTRVSEIVLLHGLPDHQFVCLVVVRRYDHDNFCGPRFYRKAVPQALYTKYTRKAILLDFWKWQSAFAWGKLTERNKLLCVRSEIRRVTDALKVWRNWFMRHDMRVYGKTPRPLGTS